MKITRNKKICDIRIICGKIYNKSIIMTRRRNRHEKYFESNSRKI